MSTHLLLPVTLALLAAVALAGGGWYVWRLRRDLAFAVHQALHDPLTGLWNRRMLHTVLDGCLRDERSFAALILDVDRFKQINDGYGHPAGDAVLIEIARRLDRDLSLETDGVRAVIRLGGDEFAVIVAGDDDHAVAVAKTVWRLLAATPINLADGEAPRVINVNLSVGVATHRLGEDASALLRHADLALRQAKQTGTVVRWHPAPETLTPAPEPPHPVQHPQPGDGRQEVWRCWFDAADLAPLADHAIAARHHRRTDSEEALLQECPGGIEIIAEHGRVLAFSTGWPPLNATHTGPPRTAVAVGTRPEPAPQPAVAHLHLSLHALGALHVAADWGGVVEVTVTGDTACHLVTRTTTVTR